MNTTVFISSSTEALKRGVMFNQKKGNQRERKADQEKRRGVGGRDKN